MPTAKKASRTQPARSKKAPARAKKAPRRAKKAQGSKEAKNRRLIAKYNRAWSRADLKALDAITSEKIAFHNPPPGLSADKQGLLETARIMHDAFGDQEVRMDHIVASKDTVACHFTVSGTHQGDFLGIPATGKRVQIEGLTLVTFRNGKVVEDFTEFDQMRLLEQLGAPSPLEAAAHQASKQEDALAEPSLWGAPYQS